MSRLVAAAVAAALALCAVTLRARADVPADAPAPGTTAGRDASSTFSATGLDLHARDAFEVRLDGYARTRGELLYNLDLDRGTTPLGRPIFPVPLADPAAQLLTHADGRLRLDVAVYPPRFGVAVKVRADLLDGLASLGSSVAAPTLVRIRRAWGEVLTPLGVLSAGRMGAHWGLGLLSNGGDCLDCDGDTAADRVQFVTPVAGLLWAAALDVTAAGPAAARASGLRSIDLDPTDDVRTVSFAVLRWRDDAARARRRAAGKTTFEWGAVVSHRWQRNDVPASWLPTAASAAPAPGATFGPGAVTPRGYTATALDAWVRVSAPTFRIELEAALLFARVDQPSFVPGVLLYDPVHSLQVGAALETEFGRPAARFAGGLDLGFASGDPAPGFGVAAPPNASAPAAGELDGPQALPPFDRRVDNFRFHADYHVDRILFREIVGTVTDAAYVRPHARARLLEAGTSTLTATLAAVASMAVYPASTPGGRAPLGVEIDPSLTWESRDGFVAALDYAVLFPLAGLDNPAAGLRARPAQLLRLRLAWVF